MGNLGKFFREVRLKLLDNQAENEAIIRFIKSCKLNSESMILDVGCGYGQKMEMISKEGFNIIGIDVNDEIVNNNKTKGFKCYHVDEFDKLPIKYNLILISHVIEHLPFDKLSIFLDYYLDRLLNGAYLIIATPLLSNVFYEDYDHVKPYYPVGINMFLCNNVSQVQYHSRNRMELQDIWFRRDPYRLVSYKGLYLKKYSRIPELINVIFALIFKISFGLIGKTNGWVGLYKKLS